MFNALDSLLPPDNRGITLGLSLGMGIDDVDDIERFSGPKHVPICTVGIHNGVAYNADFFQKAAEELSGKRLKLYMGHEDSRRFRNLLPETPIRGFVTNLSFENGVLYGDPYFTDPTLLNNFKAGIPLGLSIYRDNRVGFMDEDIVNDGVTGENSKLLSVSVTDTPAVESTKPEEIPLKTEDELSAVVVDAPETTVSTDEVIDEKKELSITDTALENTNDSGITELTADEARNITPESNNTSELPNISTEVPALVENANELAKAPNYADKFEEWETKMRILTEKLEATENELGCYKKKEMEQKKMDFIKKIGKKKTLSDDSINKYMEKDLTVLELIADELQDMPDINVSGVEDKKISAQTFTCGMVKTQIANKTATEDKFDVDRFLRENDPLYSGN